MRAGLCAVVARATLRAMPLYARHVDEHYPDRNPSEHADDFVVLSGSLEVGSFLRIANGPSEGRWSWGAGLGAATANFVASGYTRRVPDPHRPVVPRDARPRRSPRATGRTGKRDEIAEATDSLELVLREAAARCMGRPMPCGPRRVRPTKRVGKRERPRVNPPGSRHLQRTGFSRPVVLAVLRRYQHKP